MDGVDTTEKEKDVNRKLRNGKYQFFFDICSPKSIRIHMKNLKPLFLSCLLTLSFVAFGQKNENLYNIVPVPKSIEAKSGKFTFTTGTKLYVPFAFDGGRFKASAELLAERLRSTAGVTIELVDLATLKAMPTSGIMFTPPQYEGIAKDGGYRLSIDSKLMILEAPSSQGIFYGLQTLMQLMPASVYGSEKVADTAEVPCCNIEDAPRYKYRGLMLDVGRNFFPVSFVKKFIDLLAMHKMNTLHWHLTEDQGWRIEIKKYPRLTTVGSIRKESMVGHYREQKWDGKPYGGFYTQDEIKEVVKYAESRFVTIIPEIEMPGHSVAALAAYPWLSCDSTKKYEVSTTWGVMNDVYCPSERTFKFLEDVLTEVIALFPSKYIHIGGDECPKDAWKKSAFCQELIKKENLKDEHGLQSYFIQRIEKFLNSKGRSIIGWDEILEGGLAPNATVMSWRGVKGGIEAAKQKHDVVMSPSTHWYLDYYQADSTVLQPRAIGGYNPLSKVYSFDPTPAEFTAEQAKYIIGGQGNLWSEYIKTPEHMEYMAFPRGAAIAEVLWSPKEKKNLEDFQKRWSVHTKRLDALKVNYFGAKTNAAILPKVE